ncbi:hypothetical protein WN51_02547 [Melipona quadrifasciata]|uniref:CD80-like immunoglobulin C2-set domain-containing protein n=1 Tax=Melipona quadrifasciata TaxID=166423 RepID=A0A0N0BDR4_9HYME|nr:hypothetical protein WN51_02547 [Melipona quadrifasciata]
MKALEVERFLETPSTGNDEENIQTPNFTLFSIDLTLKTLPEGTPIIVSERERYDAGDTLRANCSLPPSKPPAHLSFTLNNVAFQSVQLV